MALYGPKWPFMVFYGRISSFLAVIDPNSFALVDNASEALIKDALRLFFLGKNFSSFGAIKD